LLAVLPANWLSKPDEPKGTRLSRADKGETEKERGREPLVQLAYWRRAPTKPAGAPLGSTQRAVAAIAA